MLRSMGAGLESLRRGAVESAVDSFKWLTDTTPHAILDLAARMKRIIQEKSKNFNQWAFEGYDTRQRVIYTNEYGYRINAIILEKKLNNLNEFEYTIKFSQEHIL